MTATWDLHSFYMIDAANSQVKTPVLDLLAAKGTRFELAVSNQPICTPTFRNAWKR